MYFRIIEFLISLSFFSVQGQEVDPNNLKLESTDSIVFSKLDLNKLNKSQQIMDISEKDFLKTIKSDEYLSLKDIKTYKDSLFVYLHFKFKDWKLTNAAFRRIDFSWTRLSRNLRLSKKECKNLGDDLNLDHPYLIYLFFRNENNHPFKEKHIKRINKNLVSKEFTKKELKRYSDKKILKLENLVLLITMPLLIFIMHQQF